MIRYEAVAGPGIATPSRELLLRRYGLRQLAQGAGGELRQAADGVNVSLVKIAVLFVRHHPESAPGNAGYENRHNQAFHNGRLDLMQVMETAGGIKEKLR